MENPKLGNVLNRKDAERDAIHVAIVPVVLGEHYMQPGHKVKLAYGTKNIVLPRDYNQSSEWIGIIDPFIEDHHLEKGNEVYILLKPGIITGLRHHWFHPAFDAEYKKPASSAEDWLRKFADKWNFDYDEMVTVASTPSWVNDYITAHGIDLHSEKELGDDNHLFWEKLEELTQQKYDQKHREKIVWTCSC